MAPTLAYWNFPGKAEPIKLLLTYAGVDFIDKGYSKGADGKGSEWFDEKFRLGFDFPNLPYYIDGDVKLTQTFAILRYLGRKYNLYGSTEADRIRIDVLEQQLNDVATSYMTYKYKPDTVNEEEFLKKLDGQFKQLSNFLGDRKFAAGEEISYVDFWFFVCLEFMLLNEKIEKLFVKYDSLGQFKVRVEELPKVKQFMQKQKGN